MSTDHVNDSCHYYVDFHIASDFELISDIEIDEELNIVINIQEDKGEQVNPLNTV